MGLPITLPTFGADCEHCTPFVWAAGTTPEFLLFLVQDVVRCPLTPTTTPLPNGTYILEQDPAFSCQWFLITAVFRLRYQAFAASAGVLITDILASFFGGNNGGQCSGIVANENICIIGEAANGGIAARWRLPAGASPFVACDEWNFAPVENTFHDEWLVYEDPDLFDVFRLANVPLRINLLLKVE